MDRRQFFNANLNLVGAVHASKINIEYTGRQ
jgi:hypothetical protein